MYCGLMFTISIFDPWHWSIQIKPCPCMQVNNWPGQGLLWPWRRLNY